MLGRKKERGEGEGGSFNMRFREHNIRAPEENACTAG